VPSVVPAAQPHKLAATCEDPWQLWVAVR